MSLNNEWRFRIEAWIRALDRLTYQPVGLVEFEAFFTHGQLTPEETREQHFTPIAAGDCWGAMWEYAWFRGEARVSPELHGQRLVLHAGAVTPQFGADPFGEWLVYCNGTPIGSRDWAHLHLPLTDAANGGDTFAFLIEAFGGPSRAGAGGGPALDGVPTIPDPPARQRVLPEVTFGVWREDVFQLAIDAKTLLELRDQLDPGALRTAEIDAGLRDFTIMADPELPWPEMRPSLEAARERLRPLLACRNGSTAPELFCIGHSHLDVVYQWPLRETESKVARTFSNQLALMDRYPEYRFFQSMPVLYEIARSRHPGIYEKIKEAVRRGQWIAEGGMWTEADTNLAGGESLVRQFLCGKRFFREEFGVDSIFCWAPDLFGFTGALPQIMAGCGIRYFASSKVFSSFAADGDPFPYTTFWWEGIDGTRILSHMVSHYGIETTPSELAHQWKQNPQKDGVRARMAVYGHGDGGGGCTRDHLEFLRRQADLEGGPRCRHAGPLDFFAFQEAQPETLPVYRGEIYLPAHRGTYTSQAALKNGNRRCESALREWELWAAAAVVRAGRAYPWESLAQAWRKVLFNQFHDILPGSCISRAAREAAEWYDEARAICAEGTAAAAGALAGSGSVLTIFNDSPWPRRELMSVGECPPGAECQRIGDETFIEVSVPACGWMGASEAATRRSAFRPGETRSREFESDHYLLRLDGTGRITSWIDKATDTELAVAPLNEFEMFRDTPRVCDAWDIDSHYVLQPVALDQSGIVELISDGPLASVIRVRRTLHRSELDQEIWIARHSRRIDFRTRIDWREKHKLLKVSFPLALGAAEALHEIQFGHVKRPTHRSRHADRDQFEVCQQRWSALTEEGRGVAVLNDGKYGISTKGSTLSLSLLRAPQAPDMNADIGSHRFTYSLYAWSGPFHQSEVVREAYELNSPLRIAAGASPRAESFLCCDAPNVAIDTIKLAEDRSGDVIVRLYEWARTAAICRLTAGFPIRTAFETTLLEENIRSVAHEGNIVTLRLEPFAIKTLRLVRA